MTAIVRVLVTVVTAVATFYFTFWSAGGLLAALTRHASGPVTWVLPFVLALALAFLAARFVWRRASAPAGLATAILVGGFKVGAIGFCLGFFGPILFAPGANQGPMLGIFVTGPAGFVLGAIGGWVRWAARRARETDPPVNGPRAN